MIYKLRHPYDLKPYPKVYETETEARAAALRKIKRNYPTEGKHYTGLEVLANGKTIGMVKYGLKYQGWTVKDIAHQSKKDQEDMLVLFDNHYTVVKNNKDYIYRLSPTGRLGQKYKIHRLHYVKIKGSEW